MAGVTETKTDNSISMRMTCFGIRKKFPKVQQLSTNELADWINQGRQITLLDARPESEFAVSRLQGAERVDPDNLSDGLSRAEDVISHTPVDHPVVVYCSVGYRSSMVAEKLLERWAAAKDQPGASANEGRSIYNLEGSIFKWANENRPVVDSAGAPTHLVHHYNAFWGKLLDSSFRYVPASSL